MNHVNLQWDLEPSDVAERKDKWRAVMLSILTIWRTDEECTGLGNEDFSEESVHHGLLLQVRPPPLSWDHYNRGVSFENTRFWGTELLISFLIGSWNILEPFPNFDPSFMFFHPGSPPSSPSKRFTRWFGLSGRCMWSISQDGLGWDVVDDVISAVLEIPRWPFTAWPGLGASIEPQAKCQTRAWKNEQNCHAAGEIDQFKTHVWRASYLQKLQVTQVLQEFGRMGPCSGNY